MSFRISSFEPSPQSLSDTTQNYDEISIENDQTELMVL